MNFGVPTDEELARGKRHWYEIRPPRSLAVGLSMTMARADPGAWFGDRRCCRWLPHPHGNAANLRLRSASGDAITPKRLTSNSDTFCRIVPLEEGGADAVFGVAGFRTGNEDPAEDGEPDGKDE